MNAKLTTLQDLLGTPLSLGGAITHRGLTVFPLVGKDCPMEFISLDRALPLGFRLEEIPGGDVNNLVAINPTPHFVLLLDGQEVLGARQNRIFDGSFLVAPGTETTVSVCCIERGRWEASRERESFRTASHFADPRVRAAQRSTRSLARDGSVRSDQGSVWKSIDLIMTETRTLSATASLSEVQASVEAEAELPVTHFEARDGQLGLLVYVGGELSGVELVGRTDVYRDLHEKLVRGFSIVAAEHEGAPRAVTAERAEDDLRALLREPIHLEPASDQTQRVVGEEADPRRGQGLARAGALLHWSTVVAA